MLKKNFFIIFLKTTVDKLESVAQFIQKKERLKQKSPANKTKQPVFRMTIKQKEQKNMLYVISHASKIQLCLDNFLSYLLIFFFAFNCRFLMHLMFFYPKVYLEWLSFKVSFKARNYHRYQQNTYFFFMECLFKSFAMAQFQKLYMDI